MEAISMVVVGIAFVEFFVILMMLKALKDKDSTLTVALRDIEYKEKHGRDRDKDVARLFSKLTYIQNKTGWSVSPIRHPEWELERIYDWDEELGRRRTPKEQNEWHRAQKGGKDGKGRGKTK